MWGHDGSERSRCAGLGCRVLIQPRRLISFGKTLLTLDARRLRCRAVPPAPYEYCGVAHYAALASASQTLARWGAHQWREYGPPASSDSTSGSIATQTSVTSGAWLASR